MERVLLFKLLYKIFSKVGLFNIELIFIFCITSSLFMGHFQRSPLSFIYSVAFWGVIVIFRKHPFKMIIHLNFMLYFVNSFTATSVSALSIFINPLVTSVVSCLFPFLFINAFLPDWIQLNEIVSFIINHLKDFLFFIDKIDIFPKISIETYIIVTFFILQRLFSFKIALVFLLIFYIPASPQKTKLRYDKYIHFEDQYDHKKRKWFYGENTKCRVKGMDFYCKEKMGLSPGSSPIMFH